MTTPLQSFFVTGTDTEVGKTRATLAFMAAIQKTGLRAGGMKPVASGCEATPAGLRNEDALLIQKQCSETHDYDLINPYAYEPAIAPHVAAEFSGRPMDPGRIDSAFQSMQAATDVVVVEGVGGWAVPLGPDLLLSELVQWLNLPVVIVVGLRLGCINHALLTVESVLNTGLPLCGWVANAIDADYKAADKTLETLSRRIPAPCLARFPYMSAIRIESLVECVHLDRFTFK